MKKIQEFAYGFFNKIVVLKENTKNLANLKYNISKEPLIIIKNSNKFTKNELLKIISTIKEFNITNKEANKTFYKKWTSITDKSRMELFIDQFFHYLTTYGLELENPYFPDNDIIQDLPKDTKIIIVDTITLNEFKEKLINILENNVALSEKDIFDIIYIIKKLNLKLNIDNIKNKQIKLFLYEYFDIVPNEPEEFIKYLYFIDTQETLFIKNKLTFEIFEKMDKNVLYKKFNKYLKNNDIIKLASIFNRYKKIFLAIKQNGNKNLKQLINKISKLSKKYHKPYIISDYLKTNKLNIQDFKNTINNLDTNYIIKIHNYLNYNYLSQKENINIHIYRIRNGKYFLTNKNTDIINIKEKIVYCIDVISERLKEKVNFKLNKKINYAVPTTGKQFIANIPFGTYINVNKPVVIGIYWENYKGKRIDLDLSLTNEKQKIGWNSDFYNKNQTTVFSGDVTNAKNGASELFYINEDKPLYKVNINFFNFMEYIIKDFNFKFFIADSNKEEAKRLKINYMIDTNKVIFSSKFNFNNKNLSTGVLIDDIFVFDNFSIPKTVEGLTPKDYFEALKIEVLSKLRFSDLKIDFKGEKNITELSKNDLLELFF